MVRGWLFDTTICRKKWSSDMSISKKANDWSSGIICIADGCLVGLIAKKMQIGQSFRITVLSALF